MRIHTLLALIAASLLTAADPTVVVSASAPTTAANPATFVITFSAPVQGLLPAELLITGVGGTVTGLSPVSPSSGYATQWVASIQPANEGILSLQVPPGAATTSSSEGNLVSNLLSVRYDTPPALTFTAPVVTATQITFSIQFDETWSVANAGLVTVNGAAINSQSVVTGAPFPTYDLVVTPWGDGTVRLAVGAGAFTDLDGVADANAAGSLDYAFGAAPGGTEAAVSRVRFISATDRSYDTGETVDLAVDFSRPVSVVGPAGSEPLLLLNAQGSNPVAPRATYLSTSGSTLRFRYTVAGGNYTPTLDYTSTTALVIGSQGAIVGDDHFLARTALASPGSGNSLRGSGAVGVNYTPPKPPISDVSGPNNVDSCGAGSAIGLLLATGLLLAANRYRHR